MSSTAPRRHTGMEVRCAVVDGDVTMATVRIDGDVPAMFMVDAIARLDLAARTLGWRVRVPNELRELLGFCGLPAP